MTEAVPDLPATKIRSYMSITNPEIVDSFLDPVRRAILVALRHGSDDTKQIIEATVDKDGKIVASKVVGEKVEKRFWMTVPEIVKYVKEFIAEIDGEEVDERKFKYNCYYHLPKLLEQGLIEQYPEREIDAEGKELSSKRGVYYRRAAKVFVVSGSKLSGEIIDQYLTLFGKGFEVGMTAEKENEFKTLISNQIEMLDNATEYLAAHLKEVNLDATALSDLLTGMSYIFLSDNEEFLEIQRNLKKMVLTPCCGSDADMRFVCSFCGDPLNLDSALTKIIQGKAYTFCDEGCATSYTAKCIDETCKT
ncbi:MAG: hypothetical protein ACFFEF_14490 [Candidatus Thorarchaeota archaeon]